ncbi:nSTAND1 domain-containing NTPase [Streptomyces sp. Qhu_M48]|uniref:nSTAND1 domain-containing NTPase n=1 Tax=Streptomyces sp. Qhu_M48 TaxID=3435889 RepID=UPI003F4FEC2E
MQASSVVVQETQMVILAEGETPSAVANARGHLFEKFIAKILERLGYEEPRSENMNVTSDGIEIDVTATHRLTRRRAIVECKAYSSPVSAKELVAFYGKLNTERLVQDDSGLDGFFFALPRTTQPGAEKARTIESRDPHFRYLNADATAQVAREAGLTAPPPERLRSLIVSDPAIVVTEHGVYSCLKSLDPDTRTAVEVIVWAHAGLVPAIAIDLIRHSDFAGGANVRDARSRDPHPAVQAVPQQEESVIVEVRGSESDFEYQLPASPQYFVGRRKVVSEIEEILLRGSSVVVVNAQSGWGKSSLALRVKESARKLGGICVVFDTRTAASREYVARALRKAAKQAERSGLLKIQEGASWASLGSALETLKSADWQANCGPVVVFFDQFENIFNDELLTREFRNLALGVHELNGPLSIGFAWKTDLVGWTEAHPYRLRDEIRSNARVIQLSPLGPSEVDTLLRKLEQQLGAKLVRDLKERLREYSQGLPWLFKKLAGHVLREVSSGATQSQLVSEALNVQSLFEKDLSELGPNEREGIYQIARYAPMPVSEAMEIVPTEVVQTLLNRRLIVQVGEKLDTYWDIFRDFLVHGTIPIEESFILRVSPASVGRLVREVIGLGGNAAVSDLATNLSTSETVVYNLSRDLRMFGVIAYEPTRIRLVDEFFAAVDREEHLRRRVAKALRRHRAHSTLSRLVDQHGNDVQLASFARALPRAFPAVAASEKTWGLYAKSFAQWFEYAGIARLESQSLTLMDENEPSTVVLLAEGLPYRSAGRGVFPKKTPGPAITVLKDIHSGVEVLTGGRDSRARAVQELVVLRVVDVDYVGRVTLNEMTPLTASGDLIPGKLLESLVQRPGMEEAISILRSDPGAKHEVLGSVIARAYDVQWAPGTVELVGKQVKGWAKAAGVQVRHGAAERLW